MNVKSIERKGNEATIVVEIDKDLMESGVNKAYLKARKQIMIPGFRKGKAPRKMIEAMYGAHVFYEDGLEEIFPEVYDFAVAGQEGLKAIGRPSLTDMQIGEDGSVTLTLTTEVYPEVTLGQYKGLEVEKAEATVTDEQVRSACKAVGMDHFIMTLPNGYDTVLSDRSSLSAGQRQLLTIARAMVENAPMIILDEATSSVDTRTEALVQQAMYKLTEGRTSFVIAHRLSTIRDADLILVMEKGDVVESGTHEQLLKANGLYKELYYSQFEAK